MRLLLLALPFMAFLAIPAQAQTPAYVPSARYYGSATVLGLPAPGNAAILAQGIGGAVCGSGYVSPYGGQYSVDIQPSSPCTGPITFLVNGQLADQTSVVPNYLSGAVPLNLTVSNGCGYAYGAYGCSSFAPPAPPVSPAYGIPPPPVTSVVSPYVTTATVTYQSGWNLVAGPTGQFVPGTSGPLFTFQPGDTSYQAVPASSGLQSGYGYWSQFPAPVTMTIPATGGSAVYRAIAAGQAALIGNPFSRPATISGVSAVYTYDPVRGYQTTTLLQPGQGAWAIGSGSQVIITTT
jgi:hypothetical protein